MEKNNVETLLLDLDAILNFVFEEDGNETEVTETYIKDKDDKLKLNSKICHDVKSGKGNDKQTLKYDLIKSFIDTLNIDMLDDNDEESIGQNIIFNTMVENGFIISKKVNEK